MKYSHLRLLGFALLLSSISSPSLAQSWANPAHGKIHAYDQYRAAGPSWPQTFGPIVHNANNCPPDYPEAVWGDGQALLGYKCVTEN
jgi:hypothetical protein